MNNTIIYFIVKLVAITLCLITIINCIPVQQYEFLDTDTRCNKFTGKVESYNSHYREWQNKG